MATIDFIDFPRASDSATQYRRIVVPDEQVETWDLRDPDLIRRQGTRGRFFVAKPIAIIRAGAGLWLLRSTVRREVDNDTFETFDTFSRLTEARAAWIFEQEGKALPPDLAPVPLASDPTAKRAGTDRRTAGPTAGDPARAAASQSAPAASGTAPIAGPVVSSPPEADDRRDTNTRVREALERNPGATASQIEKATGIPHPTIRNSQAWKNRPQRPSPRSPKSTDAMDRAISLTGPMLAAIDSRAADPADIAAEREEQEHPEAIEPIEVVRSRFVAVATPGQRARLNRLSLAERENELRAWDLTGDFLPDEPPSASPLRGRMQVRSVRPVE